MPTVGLAAGLHQLLPPSPGSFNRTLCLLLPAECLCQCESGMNVTCALAPPISIKALKAVCPKCKSLRL